VSREYRSNTFIQTLVAEGAIFGLGLVLGARVIERRNAVDHHRLLDIELRRRGCRLRRRLRSLGCLIGGRLLGTAAGHRADEKNRRRSDDDQF